MAFVPWAQDILDAIESGAVNLEDYDLSMATYAHWCPARSSKSYKSLKKYFPHHDYDTNYGLSESIGPGCVHLGIENIHKVGAIEYQVIIGRLRLLMIKASLLFKVK